MGMQKGDKFIVTDNKISKFNIGEVVTYDGKLIDLDLHWFYNSYDFRQALPMRHVKPLDRFPCDDEQHN